MKKRIIEIFAVVSGLLSAIIMPAQDLPEMPSDRSVSRIVLPDGLECIAAANPNVSAFADFALVSRSEGVVLDRVENVITLREEAVDSTLLRLMKRVEAHGNPSDLAVIACGDVNGESIIGKLKYMSYMVPAGTPSVRTVRETAGLTPVCIMEDVDGRDGTGTIRAEWDSPRAPESLMSTIQKAVYDKAVYEFGQAVCDRVKSSLRKGDVPYAAMGFRHVGSLETYGDEKFSFSVTVAEEDMAYASEAVQKALWEIDEYGVPAKELLLLERRYFSRLSALSERFERSNASYMDKCISAFLFNVPVVSSKNLLEFHQSKDLPSDVREKVFSEIASALVHMPSYDASGAERSGRLSASLSDTLAFPGPGVKVRLKSLKKDPLSGGQIWTFSNGFKVIYKKMAGINDGTLYYSLAMNGGFGNIMDLSPGEGAFMSDYQDWCHVAGMKSRDFRNVLGLAGITMNAQVNLSNIMVSGSADGGNAGLLMKSLLAFVNTRSLDEKEYSYYMKNEAMRLDNQGLSVGTIRSVIDSLMCPGYRYSVYKKAGHLSEKTAGKVHALFEDMASRMNDGVLVLVGNMDETKLRKLISPYVGGFRTRKAVFCRPAVSYQPVSGWTTYDAVGRRNAIVVAMSTRLSMTTENMLTSEIVTMSLKDLLLKSFDGEGFRFNVYHTCRIIPEDRFSVMITVERNDGGEIPEDFLWRLRDVLNDADEFAVSQEYLAACKVFLKRQWDINAQDHRYWAHVIAMRYLDGKDFTTGYASRIDAVSSEKVSSVLHLLEKGSKIEYVIKNR